MMNEKKVKWISTTIVVIFATVIVLALISSNNERNKAVTPVSETFPSVTTPAPSNWSIDYYVDEFGDRTDNAYIRSDSISGTFSNTATSGSNLTVFVYYDSYGDFRFRLLEYGSHKATHFTNDNISLYFKANESTYLLSLKGTSDLSSDLYLKDPDIFADAIQLFQNLLEKGETVKCVIHIGDSSKYQFSIDGTGFYSATMELDELQ